MYCVYKFMHLCDFSTLCLHSLVFRSCYKIAMLKQAQYREAPLSLPYTHSSITQFDMQLCIFTHFHACVAFTFGDRAACRCSSFVCTTCSVSRRTNARSPPSSSASDSGEAVKSFDASATRRDISRWRHHACSRRRR